MAFGLGYNKAKSLAAAEKYVMQGKIPAAIQEYQKILEQEPRDLVILNTVGDLHLRLNKTAEALTYFYRLGEAYVSDGFVRNGIAVYKKITRSDANAIEAVGRLADLYLQQGQLSEARNYLNQCVDFHSQRNEYEKCVELFEKLLLMDPENAAIKQRLAAVYEQAGKKEEAAGMYFSAAEGFADRASPADADKALRKARDLGLDGADTQVLEARILIDSGRGSDAITTLKAIPDAESNRAAMNLLYHAHLSSGDPVAAGEVATTIFQKFDDFAGVEQVAAMMIERGDANHSLSLYDHVLDTAVAQRSTQPVIDGLKSIVMQDRENLRARRMLCRVYEGTGETGEYVDVSEQLADILSQQQDFERARAIYVKLAEMEPANTMHKQRMRQMDQKMGRSTPEPVEEDMPVGAADFTEYNAPPPAPPAPAVLDEASQQVVNSALTEADQQAVFMQFDDAASVLKDALVKVPGNIPLQQKLVEVHEQAQQWPEAAAACEALTESFVMSGDGDNATRYGEMTARFQALAGGAAPPPAESTPAVTDHAVSDSSAESGVYDMAQFTVPNEAPMGIADMKPPPTAPADTFSLPEGFDVEATVAEKSAPELTLHSTETHEVDLSSEWESMMVVDEAPAGTPPAPAAMETSQVVDPFAAAEDAKIATGETGSFSFAEPEPPPADAITLPSFDEPAAAPPPAEEFSLDLDEPAPARQEQDSFELSLDLDEASAPPVAAPTSAPAATKPAAPLGMADFVGSLDDGTTGPVASPRAAAPPAPPNPPARSKPKGDTLTDVFAEFKEEMEQDSAVDSDIENHYNMGVAFKEMGLYDEAIGEFQKAYHGAENLPAHPNFIPVCTLLAHCFMAKNLPELAVKWLENALKAPGLDREGEMALRYEIGSSQEVAGLKPAALDSFMQVYAMNIDYRDVADRIRSLKGN